MEAILGEAGEDIARAVLERAKAGDMQAAKLVLERLCPPRKGREVHLALPPVHTASDVLEALGAVLAAVGAGEITPDEGHLLATLLETHRRGIETVDIEARLTALEQKGPRS